MEDDLIALRRAGNHFPDMAPLGAAGVRHEEDTEYGSQKGMADSFWHSILLSITEFLLVVTHDKNRPRKALAAFNTC